MDYIFSHCNILCCLYRSLPIIWNALIQYGTGLRSALIQFNIMYALSKMLFWYMGGQEDGGVVL